MTTRKQLSPTERGEAFPESPFARAARIRLPESNPERYAYLIGLLDRYTLRLTGPHPFRWTSCGGCESKRRAYLMGFGKDFAKRALPLP